MIVTRIIPYSIFKILKLADLMPLFKIESFSLNLYRNEFSRVMLIIFLLEDEKSDSDVSSVAETVPPNALSSSVVPS